MNSRLALLSPENVKFLIDFDFLTLKATHQIHTVMLKNTQNTLKPGNQRHLTLFSQTQFASRNTYSSRSSSSRSACRAGTTRTSSRRTAPASASTCTAAFCRGTTTGSGSGCSSRERWPFSRSWRSSRAARCCAASPRPVSGTPRSCFPVAGAAGPASFVPKICPPRRSVMGYVEINHLQPAKGFVSLQC